MTDPRIEAAARAIYDIRDDEFSDDEWADLDSTDRELYLCQATAALAAADKAATITTFTGAQVNKAGWVCGACEPGDYTKCDDCQSACEDVAQFVNRLIGGTE